MKRRTVLAACLAALPVAAAAQDDVPPAPSLDKDDLEALRKTLREASEIVEKLRRRFDRQDEDVILFDHIPDIIQWLERIRQKALSMRSVNEPDGHVDWSTMLNAGS